jgi:A/G-specific adenine glycosylase
MSELHEPVLAWYAQHARTLPWREGATPWGVLVSEVMLQQTPVSRVLPVFEAWMQTWPAPADLAASGRGDAVRAWGRLGYPRRALRLHECATRIVAEHGGEVPSDLPALRALPGVGEYTAAAVTAFAFGGSAVVLDTNVRRVLTRAASGAELPNRTVTSAERHLATSLLPPREQDHPRWAVATMELGALVCTAAKPRCEACPVDHLCAWRAAGYPPYDGPARRAQRYDGTDRQCRGRLLAVLRESVEPVAHSRLATCWSDGAQRARCLAGLVQDGLVARSGDRYRLP